MSEYKDGRGDYYLAEGLREPQTAAGRKAKYIFGPDVEFAGHPDPMTGKAWDDMAELIIDAALAEASE